MQFDAAPADDLVGAQEVAGVETGAVDDDVDFVLDAVAGADAPGRDLLDTGGDEIDIFPRQRRQIDAVVAHRALRAEGIIGRRLFEQIGPVRDLLLHLLDEHAAQHLVHRD